MAWFDDMPPEEAVLDLDKLRLPLTVRGRRPGEGWQPLGMDLHTQSLQDFFINQKVPAHWRDRWPLVCSGGRVAWVAGLRPSEAFKVSDSTERFLRLRLVKQGN
jgi:tRNA(Ile)-lysidine synthase